MKNNFFSSYKREIRYVCWHIDNIEIEIFFLLVGLDYIALFKMLTL
jgi:hypothetical protein